MDEARSFPQQSNAGENALKTVWWLTVLAVMVAILMRRSPTTIYATKRLSLQQALTALELAISVAFVYSAAILEVGVGAAHDATSCSAGILLCFLAYGASKAIQFGFFTERIYLVWSTSDASGPPITRLQSKWYRASAAMLFLWWAGGMSMIVSRFSKLSENEDVCYIGLRRFGSVVVVVLQGLVDLYFTVALVLPLRSTWLSSPKGRSMARSTAIATAIAFVISAANITGIVVQGDKGQKSWICMLNCGLDIGINSLVMFFITLPPAPAPPPTARRASFVSQFGTALPPVVVPPQNFGVGFDHSDRDSFVSRDQEHEHGGIGRRASEILSPALTAFSFQWPRRGSKDEQSVASWEEKV